ncbi:MAG: hypothetical protein J5999_03320 [Oscillospiraceae bacterium]|nr:hypothetical protein [Oscillospiraceae bacterium]
MTAFDYIADSVKDSFVGEEYPDVYMLSGRKIFNMESPKDSYKYDLVNCFFKEGVYNDKAGNECYIVSKEYMEKLKSIEVTFDEGTEDYDTNTRRPYYQLRGKRVSEEQALEFIRRTDMAFCDPMRPEEEWSFYQISMYSDLFTNFFSNGPVHPNGVVGMNGVMSKYPNIYELFAEFVSMAAEFPFLELIIGITWWDETPPEEFEKIFTSGYEAPASFPNFTKNLDIGVWVHDSKVEFLSPENAAKKYKEYDKLYGEADGSVYCQKRSGSPEYFDFYKKCLEANGVSGEALEKCLDKFRKEVIKNGL